MAIETTPAGGDTLVGRAKRILIEPKAEWPRIDAERTTIGEVFTGYVMPLAAIGPVAGLIGGQLFGYGAFGITVRPSLGSSIGSAVIGYGLALVSIVIVALIIDALAPRFGGVANRTQAVKVAAYSSTAAWLAGVFGVVPSLAFLSLLGLYGFYLLYTGLPVMMRTPKDKAMPFTVVTVIVAVVIGLVVGAVTAAVGSLFWRPTIGAETVSGEVTVPGVGKVDLGAMQVAAAKMEAQAKRMEAGETVTVAPATLQALLPDAIGAYRRTEISSSGASIGGGLGGSGAEARYAAGDSSFELKISDIAAAGALAAFGSALNMESNRETETGYERMGKVDGRMVTEKWDARDKDGSYGVLVADRIMVEAEGNVESVDVLKGAVAAVGIERVAALAK